jgi:hypothetical protein
MYIFVFTTGLSDLFSAKVPRPYIRLLLCLESVVVVVLQVYATRSGFL